MLTNTERQQIVDEVNAGTYGIDEALDDIAAAQKGEEVRKALYAEALVLNREGHAGSTDMIARQQIANLQTTVSGQISTLRSEVGDDIDDLETALNSGLATQNDKIAAQDATIANVVANYNVEYGSTELWASTGETGALAAGTTVTLSEDVSHFDYIDIYSFCGNSNVLDTVPVDTDLQTGNGYALRWVNLSDPGSGTYEAYVRIVETKIHISGTTLTINHQVTYSNGASVSISGVKVTQDNKSTYMGEFGIMKVVGRKITANTEVTDIRTGVDGNVYNTAGAAVRAQIGDVADAIPAIDTTLSVSGAAADAAAVGAALLNAGGGGADVPSSVRQALYALLSSAAYTGMGLDDDIAVIQSWAQEISSISLNNDTASISGSGTVQLAASTVPSGGVVAWSSSNMAVATVSSAGLVTSVGNGTCYITASSGGKTARCAVTVSGLKSLTGIAAVYTPSGTVYDTATLDDLKTDLVVTASYDDSSSAAVTNYTLSGTIAEGTCTITVTYGGFTDTFTVTVVHQRDYIAYWDFTQSLTDSVGGLEFALSNSQSGDPPTRDSSGLHFTAGCQLAQCTGYTGAKYTDGRTYEFDIASSSFAGNSAKHKRLFGFGNGYTQVLIFRNAGVLQIYDSSWKTFTAETGQTIPASIDALSGHTVGVKLGTDKTMYLYIDGTLVGTCIWTNAGYNLTGLIFGGKTGDTADAGNQIYNMTITGLRIYGEEV